MAQAPAPVSTTGISTRGALIAAIFMVAIPAIGPGSIPHTARFSAAFALVALASTLIKFAVHMNTWRITLPIGIFLSKRAGMALDRTIIWLGLLMIGIAVFVAIVSNSPMAEALRQTGLPDVIDFASVVTSVGGTVCGYITCAGFWRAAGPHRGRVT